MKSTEQNGFESRPRLQNTVFGRVKRLSGTEKNLHQGLHHKPRCWCHRIRPHGSHVYVVASIEGPRRYKIGRAMNPRKRFGGLCSASAVRLELLMYAPGGPWEEERLHVWLRGYHEHGEWFRDGPLTLALLAAMEADIAATYAAAIGLMAGTEEQRIETLQKIAESSERNRLAQGPVGTSRGAV